MKGSDLLRSAFKDVAAREDCCAGAKAEADAARRVATAANFIMVLTWLKCVNLVAKA